jgi:putative phage-type endonuclease
LRKADYRSFKRFGFGERFDGWRCDTDEEWSDFRRKGIGGSDVAAIMGLSPWKTPLQVWLQKTGRDGGDEPDNEAMYWGRVLEADVARRFAEEHPELKVRNVNATLVRTDAPWMHANLDRMVVMPDGSPAVLEIKTASAYKADEWEDGIPPYYITQIAWYLLVTGWRSAFVAVLIGGNRYREYQLLRDEDDVKAVRDAATSFWDNFVVPGVMPQAVGADSGALAEMFPGGKDLVDAPDNARADELVEAYRRAACDETDARGRKADAAAALEQMAGDGKGLLTDLFRVTWTRGETSRLDSKRLAEERPDIAMQYTIKAMRNGGIRIKEIA